MIHDLSAQYDEDIKMPDIRKKAVFDFLTRQQLAKQNNTPAPQLTPEVMGSMTWSIRMVATDCFSEDDAAQLEAMYQLGFSIDKHLSDTRPNFLLQHLVQRSCVNCFEVYLKNEGPKEFSSGINIGNVEVPLFIYAATFGNKTMLERLVGAGVDIHAKGPRGENALYWANATGRNTENIEYLFQLGLRPYTPDNYDVIRDNLILSALDAGLLDCTDIVLEYVNDTQILSQYAQDLFEAKIDGQTYKESYIKVKAKLDILQTQEFLKDNVEYKNTLPVNDNGSHSLKENQSYKTQKPVVNKI